MGNRRKITLLVTRSQNLTPPEVHPSCIHTPGNPGQAASQLAHEGRDPHPQPIPSVCQTLHSPLWTLGLPLQSIFLCQLGDLSTPQSSSHTCPQPSGQPHSLRAPAHFITQPPAAQLFFLVLCQTLKAPSPMEVHRSDSLLHSLSWASAGGYNNYGLWSQRACVEPGSSLPMRPPKRITPTHSPSKKVPLGSLGGSVV